MIRLAGTGKIVVYLGTTIDRHILTLLERKQFSFLGIAHVETPGTTELESRMEYHECPSYWDHLFMIDCVSLTQHTLLTNMCH